VPHPAWPDPHVEPVRIEGAPVFGAFGHINVTKRIPQLLSAFARVTRAHPDARLVLVGAESPGFDLDRRLQRLGADPRGVIREGFADEARLWSLITACDAVVSLRAPTMGETSGTAIRALVLGKPLVVSDIGWFSELPGDVALKVPADDDEVDILTAALELLVANAAVRSDLGTAARELARTVHRLDRVADLYVAALEEVTGGAAVEDAVLGDVARAASDVGIDPDAPEAAALARRLTEVELAE
jgi:glycosyltransferase involved in cell wall biosynthesis